MVSEDKERSRLLRLRQLILTALPHRGQCPCLLNTALAFMDEQSLLPTLSGDLLQIKSPVKLDRQFLGEYAVFVSPHEGTTRVLDVPRHWKHGRNSESGPFAEADAGQAVAALTTTRTFSPNPTFDTLISRRPSLTVACNPSGSISDGRSNIRKTCLERRSE